MKWTRPSILVLLIIITGVSINVNGLVNTAAGWFIFLALWVTYKYWVKKSTYSV